MMRFMASRAFSALTLVIMAAFLAIGWATGADLWFALACLIAAIGVIADQRTRREDGAAPPPGE